MTAWLNPADAAEMLGVTESVIRDTCERTKLLQCKDIGSKGMHYWRVSLPSLLDWEGRIETNRVETHGNISAALDFMQERINELGAHDNS